MGYYTDYTIDAPKEVLEALAEQCSWIDDREYFYEYGQFNAKWYEYKEDMIGVSKKFPKILIEVHGAGEDYGDYWKHYFKNGKSKYCEGKIVYEEFDETMLMEDEN